MKVPFLDLDAQYATIEQDVNNAMLGVVRRHDFILGKEVPQFEEAFAAYCGVRYAVSVDSGTSALELALRALNIGPGDEVITAANTFIATTLAISYTGAKPMLVDIDARTCNIDVTRIEEAITPATKAIIPVHLFGQPADMDAVLEIAERRGLAVIEDACQAHGARYKGKRAGSLGQMAAFSFYPGKNLGAYGDGGIVVTNDAQLADNVQMLRNYGQREKYHHLLKGYNRRLDTLQAAVLLCKLPHLDAWNAARRQHAQRYRELLAGSPVGLTEEAAFAESVYHLFVVRVANRDAVAARLKDQGISTVIHYPVPIHLQPAYADLGYANGRFPVTEAYAKQIISLPMYAELTEEAIAYVASTLIKAAQDLAKG